MIAEQPKPSTAAVFCLICGVALCLGMAWNETWPAWVGVIGLGCFFYLQAYLRSFLSRIFSAFAAGSMGFAIACYWLPDSLRILTGMGTGWCWGMACAGFVYQGLVFVYYSIGFHFLSKTKWGIFAAPAIWFLAEQLYPSFYPCDIGYLIADYPVFCQVAQIGGAALVSLQVANMAFVATLTLSVLFPGTWAHQSVSTRLAVLIGISLILGSTLAWSQTHFHETERSLRRLSRSSQSSKLFVVQCNTEHSTSNERMVEAARQVAGTADLIIWPECAIGHYDQTLVDFSDSNEVAQHSKGTKCRKNPFPNGATPLIAGGDSYVNKQEKQVEFVSAFMFDEQQRCIGRHDKIELMPGGEYIPFESILPALRSFFPDERLISPGTNSLPIGTVKGRKIGTVLCCEDMHPRLFRAMCNQGAQLLVSIGNGMAFNSVIALRQHYRIARLRSIENRRYFVRCTSHGVSALINPAGRTEKTIPSMENNAMLIRVPHIPTERTLFHQIGETIPWGISVLNLLLILLPHFRAARTFQAMPK